ncbi:MAG: hypothetical protein H3C39_06790 [Flavobacteriia bacterium]|nr:hypothetical protein [Flavobacteriia bacterium]
MDILSYDYSGGNGNSNLLLNVSDAVSTGNSMGFVDGNTNPALDDYEYDANDFRAKDFEKVFCEETERSSMVKDRNKGITSITYNYLNLPELIIFENSNSIEYTYNAAGVKLKKTVIEETATPEVRIEVDYLDGFQYAGEMLNFFPTAEGYVRATPAGNITPGAPPTGYAYSYVFNYTDHLGNVRLSYSMDHLTGKLKILEENHYYPFGLMHQKYSAPTGRIEAINNETDKAVNPENPLDVVSLHARYDYKYNNREWQDDNNLDWYAMDFRNYDPAVGRFHNPDLLSEVSPDWSPYRFAFNNPVAFNDPTGLWEGDIEIDLFFDESSNYVEFDFLGWRIKLNLPEGAEDPEGGDVNYGGEENVTDTERDFDNGKPKKGDKGQQKDPKPWDLNGDGKLQKDEADLWGVTEAKDITVDNQYIDWTGLKIPKGLKDGDEFYIGTVEAFRKLPYETAATYGGTSFKIISVEKGIVEVLDQDYHYDILKNTSIAIFVRNLLTDFGRPRTMEQYHHKFRTYNIHYKNPQIQLKK